MTFKDFSKRLACAVGGVLLCVASIVVLSAFSFAGAAAGAVIAGPAAAAGAIMALRYGSCDQPPLSLSPSDDQASSSSF
jgi:hypothetical protein